MFMTKVTALLLISTPYVHAYTAQEPDGKVLAAATSECLPFPFRDNQEYTLQKNDQPHRYDVPAPTSSTNGGFTLSVRVKVNADSSAVCKGKGLSLLAWEAPPDTQLGPAQVPRVNFNLRKHYTKNLNRLPGRVVQFLEKEDDGEVIAISEGPSGRESNQDKFAYVNDDVYTSLAIVRDGNTITMYKDGDAKRVHGDAGDTTQKTIPDFDADPSDLLDYALTGRDIPNVGQYGCFVGKISHVLVDDRPYSAQEIADEHACAAGTAGDASRCPATTAATPCATPTTPTPTTPTPSATPTTPSHTYVEASMGHTDQGKSTAFCYGYSDFALNSGNAPALDDFTVGAATSFTKDPFGSTGECPDPYGEREEGSEACKGHYKITRRVTLAQCEALCDKFDLCAEIQVKTAMTENSATKGDCIMLRTGCEGNTVDGRVHPYIYDAGQSPYNGNFKVWDVYRKQAS